MIDPIIQSDFSGGINLFDADTKIADNEYCLATNIRNRNNELICAKQPLEDTFAPNGTKQGLYAFDRYLLLFNNGAAYYKDVLTDGDWTRITNFAMSPAAPYIYAEAVPASTMNFGRKLQESSRVDGSSSESNVDVDPIQIGGTLAGLVCQDGESQPWLIKPDGTARMTSTYTQWVKETNREYVPIGKQMKYINGILFVVVKDTDGKWNILTRSVSGRPLDFVVNIKQNGDKGGDAYTTAYTVGSNTITCLSSLNSGELFVGTERSVHPVEFNYEKTIFAEPTFLNRRPSSVGVINQHSFIDILSDYTFIDYDGIRSFNAVASLQNEGRNSIFSAKVLKAFEGIKQSTTAAIVFDNYSFFSVTTVYGERVAVYDNNRLVWVSFDDLGIGAIKQFAVANQGDDPTLYCITETSVYKLYKSSDELTGTVRFKAATIGRCKGTVRLTDVYATFDNGATAGVATVTEIRNNQEGAEISRILSNTGEVDQPVFVFSGQAKNGWKTQVELSWDTEATLPCVEIHMTDNNMKNQVK